LPQKFRDLAIHDGYEAHGKYEDCSGPTSQQFAEFVLRIGDGREPTFSTEQHQDYIRVPSEMVFQPANAASPLGIELIHEIYKDLATRWTDPEYILERAILTPKNEDVHEINNMATTIFPGEETVYLSQDSTPTITTLLSIRWNFSIR
jgi:hypothetical protein